MSEETKVPGRPTTTTPDEFEPGFTVTQQLSLHIIAHLAMTNAICPAQIGHEQGAALFWMFSDIDYALRTGLPQIDHAELEEFDPHREFNRKVHEIMREAAEKE